MKRRVLTLLLLLSLALLVHPFIYAQVDYSTATLRGVVYDPQHLFINGATVTISNASTGFNKTLSTAADGEYRFPLLAPGTYQVEAQAQGFAKAAATVAVSVGQIANYDFHLAIGSAATTVTVSGEIALIQTTQTQQANTIDERLVSEIPSVSRNLVDSVFTLPGVAKSEAPRAQNPGFSGFQSSGFSIGGSNGRNNLVTIDGGENDYGSGQLRTPNVPISSIQEFQVNRSSFAAEFGFTAGTAVKMVTKGGSNGYHGSAYIFFRNQSTDAANYFAPKTRSKAFEQNVVPGFTVGGPIIKNKMFFFTAFEYKKTDTPQFRSYATSATAQGINSSLSPGPFQLTYTDQLANSGNPTLIGISGALRLALDPWSTYAAGPGAPTNSALTTRLLVPNTGAFNDWKKFHNLVTRIDYQPSNNDTLTGRFSFMQDDANRMYILDPLNSPDDATVQYWRDYTLTAGWSHVFNPRVLNQLRVQIVPSDTADVSVASPDTAYLTLGTLGNFQGEHYEPYYARQRRFQFEDSVSWTKGKHTLKFGTSYRPVSYLVEDHLWMRGEFNFYDGSVPLLAPIQQAMPAVVPSVIGFNLSNGPPGANCPANPDECYMKMVLVNGSPTFVSNPSLIATNMNALQTFDLGIPVAFRQGFGNPRWNGWGHNLGSFAQDSWKLTNSFTVDFGGRIDYSAEASPIPHHVFFSPRLGFAWSPGGSRRTVIRGGGGVFVAPVSFYNGYILNLLGGSGKYINQFATSITEVDPNTGLPVPVELWGYGLQTGKLPFGQLTDSDLNALGFQVPGQKNLVIVKTNPDFENVQAIQASLSVQRELLRNLSLEVGYQMYHGLHQQIPLDTNVREIPCDVLNPMAFNSAVDPFTGPCYTQIDPNYTQIETYSSIGSSIYHGVTASLTRQFSHGLQFQLN